MMNIFIMVLVALIMGAYYMMGSPSLNITAHETQTAVMHADMRAIADCAVAAHNATIRGTEFNDPCVAQNYIQSEAICLNSAMAITKCEIQRNRKPAYSYIITSTGVLPDTEYNNMLEILERHYPDAGTFGIFIGNQILSGGTSSKRTVPKPIIADLKLQDGQLIYLTQYEMADTETEFATPDTADIKCTAGTVKTYRFGRWQCVGYNMKTNCAGDMIWDSDAQECVPDESRKPLCASEQTAIMVDDVWECINPFPDKQCPANMIARLNYATLEWECVTDPNLTQDIKKCDNITMESVYGSLGATLRVRATSCTDCEMMLTDMETCTAVCVPDPSKINDAKCYPDARDCSGDDRAFYFGFPNYSYAANVDTVRGKSIPIDVVHSQNRKFNCLDCGGRGINTSKSFPPFIAICN